MTVCQAEGDSFQRSPYDSDLVYYRCPGACTLLLNGLGEALQDTHFELGKDFDVVTMTVDPNEVDLSAAKRKTYVDALSLERGSTESWRFFTATKPVIGRLTDQTGFNYVYDPDTLQYIIHRCLFLSPPNTKSCVTSMVATFNQTTLIMLLSKPEGPNWHP